MVPNSHRHFLPLDGNTELEAQAFETLLATALRGVIAELFFTEAGLLIGYINAGQASNIEDIVDSSAELTLKPGALRYGRHAITQSDWGRPPTVSLDLEFHHTTLSVYFKLVFEATSVGVAIDGIDFRAHCTSHEESLALLRAALEDSRAPT
ncbi:hypothetical protein [Xanthobacter agilis]|uniref:Uncharacterized protein n=1 Tax=Xanthobacter agilis TaxID=47492 RepID=A0ABU0LHR2_XANAG|nr:hypothetical protein [Xanthobacter agilis]MDQ0506671.1 hypothetical protein [Xanthobacter agilis]